jgi:hypothetical protein
MQYLHYAYARDNQRDVLNLRGIHSTIQAIRPRFWPQSVPVREDLATNYTVYSEL